MMSVYANMRRPQFNVSNQNDKVVPNCYDNDSFLPDVFPPVHHKQQTSYCHQQQTYNNKDRQTSKTSSTQRNVTSHLSNVQHAKNDNKTITTTRTQQQQTCTAKRTQFHGKAHNALVSEDDVMLSIGNKLPVIMNDLCLNQRCHVSLSSTAVLQKNSIKASPAPKSVEATQEITKERHNNKIINCNVSSEKYMMPPALAGFGGGLATAGNNDEMRRSVHNMATTTTNRDEHEMNNQVRCRSGTLQEIGKVCEEEENDYFLDQFDFSSEINDKQRRFGRLKRSATNDESMLKHASRNENENLARLPRCKSIDSTSSLRSCADEQAHFFSAQVSPVPSKPQSKKKLLRRSMSLGFSKFKLITTNFSSKSHQRFEDDDINIEVKETEYETSRRKNTSLSSIQTQATIEDLLKATNMQNVANSAKGGFPPLLRSMSAPEPIDMDEDYDEDLSELYLPRRRAICPNLPVPAMKQLKTYLILTRLKQYCFV